MRAGLTKTVLETALDAEMTEHLGYEAPTSPYATAGTPSGGTRTETVLTEIGPVEIEVPRDRDSSFDPLIVRKRQRRRDGIDEIVLSLAARGLTTGEVSAHFEEVYGAKVSKDTTPGSPTRSSKTSPSGRTGRWTRSTRCCSSTRST